MTKMTIDEKITKIQEKFIKCDDVVRALDTAQMTSQNIILWGPGGYGKSEVSEEYLKIQGITPFIQAMGAGMTEEKIFGGMDLKKFNDEGVIEYLVEQSFMAYEYVIFEELFDAPMRILLSLKDVITSGKLRNGSQVYDIKTKLIICCTNRSKHEVMEDDSHKALLERFPLIFHMSWNSHTQEDFQELFTKRTGDPIPKLANLIASMHSSGAHISPRTAVKMSKVWQYNGVDGLKYVDGVPTELLDLMRVKHEEKVKEEKRNAAFDDFVAKLKELEIWQAQKTPEDYEPLLMNCILAGYIATELKNILVPDEAASVVLQKMIKFFEDESKKWYTIAFENAQPSKKLVRPLKKLFDEYAANSTASI